MVIDRLIVSNDNNAKAAIFELGPNLPVVNLLLRSVMSWAVDEDA